MKPLAAILLLATIALVGCESEAYDPGITYHTRRVWRGEDHLGYVFEYHNREYGCAHIERENNGWIYHASVIDWKDAGRTSVHVEEPESDWNTLAEAEAFVERWCKP